MELTIDETHAKRLLKEVLIELVHERQDLFLEIMLEALEETRIPSRLSARFGRTAV